jgi:hypothetical protein
MFWFDAHGGAGVWRKKEERGCVRLRREWLEVLIFVWCPRSGGHKRADLFQMCGLGMGFEKGASSRLEDLEPCPVSWRSRQRSCLTGRHGMRSICRVPAGELVCFCECLPM